MEGRKEGRGDCLDEWSLYRVEREESRKATPCPLTCYRSVSDGLVGRRLGRAEVDFREKRV